MAKLEKTKKALDLVSEAYKKRVILGFGAERKRKLLMEARRLVEEEIEEMGVHKVIKNSLRL